MGLHMVCHVAGSLDLNFDAYVDLLTGENKYMYIYIPRIYIPPLQDVTRASRFLKSSATQPFHKRRVQANGNETIKAFYYWRFFMGIQH